MAGVYIWQDVLSQHHIDPGIIVEGPFSVIERQGSPRHRVIGKVVIKQRHAGRQNLIRTGHIVKGVYIHRLELVAVDAQGTIGSNHIWVVYDLAAHVPL